MITIISIITYIVGLVFTLWVVHKVYEKRQPPLPKTVAGRLFFVLVMIVWPIYWVATVAVALIDLVDWIQYGEVKR